MRTAERIKNKILISNSFFLHAFSKNKNIFLLLLQGKDLRAAGLCNTLYYLAKKIISFKNVTFFLFL